MRSATGFSLIELLVTLSIIALTLLMTAPSFSAYNQTSKVKDAGTSIQVELQRARMESIKRNANVGIDFVPGAPDQLVLFVDDNTSGGYEAGMDTAIHTVNLHQDVNLDTTAATGPDGTSVTFQTNPPTIIYTPDGAVYQFGGTTYNGTAYVKLTGPAEASVPEYAVTVGQFGAIQVFRYDGTTWKER